MIDPEDDELQEEQPEVVVKEETLNLTDARQQRRQRKRVDNELEQASKFWRDVFAQPVGRREIWKLLQSANSEGSPFTPPFACGPSGFPQPEATWFHAGQYALGQWWYQHWMQHDRDGVFQMLDEHDPRFKGRKKPV